MDASEKVTTQPETVRKFPKSAITPGELFENLNKDVPPIASLLKASVSFFLIQQFSIRQKDHHLREFFKFFTLDFLNSTESQLGNMLLYIFLVSVGTLYASFPMILLKELSDSTQLLDLTVNSGGEMSSYLWSLVVVAMGMFLIGERVKPNYELIDSYTKKILENDQATIKKDGFLKISNTDGKCGKISFSELLE